MLPWQKSPRAAGSPISEVSALPDFDRLWPRLQQLGLNAYEARTYLVLLGHPRFKAMEAAARANVPRQKIYEVLDSLLEKGFAEVLQEKTKSFSAVEPAIAIPAYLARKEREFVEQVNEQRVQAERVIRSIESLCARGITERANLDYLRIVNETEQTASHFREMLESAQEEYLEFARPPYAVNPLDEQLVREACARGVRIRLLVEEDRDAAVPDEEDGTDGADVTGNGQGGNRQGGIGRGGNGQAANGDRHPRAHLLGCSGAELEIRAVAELPMKLALFDRRQGILALPDPLTTRETWTAIRFDHAGFAGAMADLFEMRWMAAGEASRLRRDG
jgi:HTH-type transcriptional regulator, sugar sensing transcriptional regulator